MGKANKYRAIVIISIIGVVLIISLFFLIISKNLKYKEGIERTTSIRGTYVLNDHDKNSAYFSIDYGAGIDEFRYFKADNQIIEAGSVKKSSDDYYVLYDKDKKRVYGKIIPSYKKIYFIDKHLNIIEFDYYSEQLIYPAELKATYTNKQW